MKTRTTTEFQLPPGDKPWTMSDLRDFMEAAADVPGDAVPQPITREIGSQRDPWSIPVGMRVTWEREV